MEIKKKAATRELQPLTKKRPTRQESNIPHCPEYRLAKLALVFVRPKFVFH